jgi:hypothetical protein
MQRNVSCNRGGESIFISVALSTVSGKQLGHDGAIEASDRAYEGKKRKSTHKASLTRGEERGGEGEVDRPE